MIKTKNKTDVKLNNLNGSLIIKNSPISFKKRFNTTEIDFKDIIGIYWDGDDWCQYGEVLPSDDDILHLEASKSDLSNNEGRDFLKKLIS